MRRERHSRVKAEGPQLQADLQSQVFNTAAFFPPSRPLTPSFIPSPPTLFFTRYNPPPAFLSAHFRSHARLIVPILEISREKKR